MVVQDGTLTSGTLRESLDVTGDRGGSAAQRVGRD